MEGKLIIIESGSDSSGKATQSKLLFERLHADGLKVRKVEFPNYKSESSALVKMYLNGDFGKDPGDVDPYVASTFYSVDRYATFQTEWKEFYRNGGIIIADRYTTSNMVHQAAKLCGEEKDRFLDWLWNYEFKLFGLPVPDQVIFLNMPPEISLELMRERDNKFTGGSEKDIHEANEQYLRACYNNALYVCAKYGWSNVDCAQNGCPRSIGEIHEEIYSKVKAKLL